MARELYRVGLALLDPDDPAKVLHRLPEWVMGPSTSCELQGDVPGVVFLCGWVHNGATDRVRLYYGAADSTVAMAEANLAELLSAVLTRAEPARSHCLSLRSPTCPTSPPAAARADGGRSHRADGECSRRGSHPAGQ